MIFAMEELIGFIERITFQNEENGFTIAKLKSPKIHDLITVVGFMPAVNPGETIRCSGEWKKHLIHGRQFEIQEYRMQAPADILGIKKYLCSGLIKGIGPAYAGRIVEKFGTDTLNVIDSEPDRLFEVEGIGGKRVNKIKECWAEQRSIREVMIFLQANNVSPAYAQKVFKKYGPHSISKVKENPYNLARDIPGIGFKIADDIARKLGIPKESELRTDAGIEYVLSELADDGHVCYPVEEFLEIAQKTLETEIEKIRPRLEVLKQLDRIELFELFVDGQMRICVWKKPLFMAESGIAREIARLKRSPTHLRNIDTDKAVAWVQQLLKIELAPQQKVAVSKALTDKVHIITGGPGTGKSTITNAILKVTEKLTGRIVLAAPTGRAAKRMSEITGKKASTIHSLLEFDYKGGFKRNRENPIECDLLIVDEASMIDTFLMYNLLKAVPSGARVIFVGDINQLPSVGPGNVLKDMIASLYIPVTGLTEIYRQAAGSQIITNAHMINKGLTPSITNQESSDFFFIEANDNEEVVRNILGLVSHRLPKKYGFHPMDDIQVLAPMKRGAFGTENLNASLQDTLNPKDNPLFRAGRKFMCGDKVMQLKNDYERGVYNGDIGKIEKINLVEQQVIVSIDNRDVEYSFADLDELALAYAVSVHKYQGSECPCIVMPVHTSHYMLLNRNLLYTAVTRGKKLVVLVGTRKALYLAIQNDEVRRRYTGLKQALMNQ